MRGWLMRWVERLIARERDSLREQVLQVSSLHRECPTDGTNGRKELTAMTTRHERLAEELAARRVAS